MSPTYHNGKLHLVDGLAASTTAAALSDDAKSARGRHQRTI